KYKDAAKMLKGHNKVMLQVLILTVFQRLAQIAVVVCVFIATSGNLSHIFDIFSIEGFVISGSYCIPIPGAIGVSDYLMLNGFKTLMAENVAVNLELIGRGISFYCCIIVCGVTIFIKYLLLKRRSRK
ncbi:MAG: lysylphosphatidylglycerol synthase domain-containing protein, partial [Bacilli bacterium]|nr:lysylphosphatidylglycerol synthase domain-containing protein [Bacilli bacterium]